MEVEYISASDAAKEAFWFKKFITELGVMSLDAIPLYCDNNDVIALAKEFKSHQRVDSIDNMVDLLTKLLSQQKTKAHIKKMGLRYITNWL